MSLSFARAPRVNAGDAITSTQLSRLAQPFNDRIVGISDCAWRIIFYALSMCRWVRNEDGDLVPSEAEFLQYFAHGEPSKGTWPLAEAGEPGGANLNSPLMAYVFGNENFSLMSEADRISDFPLTIPGGLNKPSDYWELAKRQRGAWDSATGAISSPAFELARCHYRIAYSPYSRVGNSYGGWMPVPEVGDACEQDDPSLPPPINWLYKFTATDVGLAKGLHDKTYDGSCQPMSGDSYPTHVIYIQRLPEYFVVVLNDGTTDVLWKTDYVEGPYTGGARLMKEPADSLTRVLNQFVREFRGARPTAIPGGERGQPPPDDPLSGWLAKAFDFQRFLTTQWHLAPARGIQSGDVITLDYPSGSPQGALVLWNGHSSIEPHEGFVLDSMLVTGTAPRPVMLLIVVDGEQVQTATLGPAGSINQVVMLTAPVRHGQHLEVASPDFHDTNLAFELAEIRESYPQLVDSVIAMRVASARFDTTVDGQGVDEDLAKDAQSSYFSYGCFTNLRGYEGIPGDPASANTNSIEEAARRLTHWMRYIPRTQIVDYAVVNGDSVLWFKRHINVSGSDLDCFSGIDNITHISPEKGFTNEWVMTVELAPYDLYNAAPWGEDVYADRYAFHNRCMMSGLNLATGYNYRDVRWHTAYGSTVAAPVEAPSGFQYSKGLNSSVDRYGSSDDQIKHYKSCQIYKPSLSIKSAELVTENEIELVKVTIDGRMHNTHGEVDGAPASIARGPSSWSDDPQSEPWLSDEGGLRQYLLRQAKGIDCARQQIGGSAPVTTGAWGDYESLRGPCLPHFLFVKLIPKPYEDDNDLQNTHDTPLWHDVWPQMELYLRAMCEAFVDGLTSTEYGCLTGIYTLWDYTYENLCYDAFRGSGMQMAPLEVRPDGANSFGPLPNTHTYALSFDQFAEAIDKLDKLRIELPLTLQSCSKTAFATRDLESPQWGNGISGSGAAAYDERYVATIPTVTCGDADYYDGISSYGAQKDSFLTDAHYASAEWGLSLGTTVGYTGVTTIGLWRLSPTQDELYALPDTLRDLVVSNFGMLGMLTRSSFITQPLPSPGQTGWSNLQCQGQAWEAEFPEAPQVMQDDRLSFHYRINETVECALVQNLQLIPDNPEPGPHIWWQTNTAFAPCFSGSTTRIQFDPVGDGNFVGFVKIPLVD